MSHPALRPPCIEYHIGSSFRRIEHLTIHLDPPATIELLEGIVADLEVCLQIPSSRRDMYITVDPRNLENQLIARVCADRIAYRRNINRADIKVVEHETVNIEGGIHGTYDDIYTEIYL